MPAPVTRHLGRMDPIIHDYTIESPSSVIMPSIFVIFMLICYPRCGSMKSPHILTYGRPDYFSNVFGDTAMIAGVGNGVLSAVYVSNTIFGFHHVPFPWIHGARMSVYDAAHRMQCRSGRCGCPRSRCAALSASHCLDSCGVLRVMHVPTHCCACRLVVKYLAKKAVYALLPPSHTPNDVRYAAVVPIKFIVYTVGASARSTALTARQSIGFFAGAAMPFVFQLPVFQLDPAWGAPPA